MLIIIFASFLLLSRLFLLSYLKPNAQAFSASHKGYIPLYYKRGNIYYENGSLITNSKSGYFAIVSPGSVSSEKVLSSCKFSESERAISLLKKNNPFLIELKGKTEDSEGFKTLSLPLRYADDTAIHIVGGLNEGVGVSGIEKAFDGYLKGEAVYCEYDAFASGRDYGELNINGSFDIEKRGIRLSLSEKWQKIAERALSAYIKEGAAVMLDIETGGIAAMASVPCYDRKTGSSPDGGYLTKPLLCYNLGSSFKIVDSIAFFSQNEDLDKKYYCGGEALIKGRAVSCSGAHGYIGIKDAFKDSCNVYFIYLLRDIIGKDILGYVKALRLTEPLSLAEGINASAGNMPSGESLSLPLSLANTAIGQGELLATPLRLASLCQIVASGGIYREPYLIAGRTDDNGITVFEKRKKEQRVCSEFAADCTADLMREVAENGSGKRAKPDNISVSCKTATAQTGIKKDGKNLLMGYVVGFFPAEKPKYALAVLCEDAVSGAKSAGPAFRYIAEQYDGE